MLLRLVLAGLLLMGSKLAIGAIDCKVNGISGGTTCQCRRLRVTPTTVQLPDYAFTDATEAEVNMGATIQCRRRNGNPTEVQYEIWLDGTPGSRVMTQGGDDINFDAYQESATTTVIGNSSATAETFTKNITAGVNTWQTFNMTFPVRVPINQNVPSGDYVQTSYRVRARHPQGGGTRNRSQSATFQVTVLPACIVSVADMSFGTYIATDTLPKDASAAGSVECTPDQTVELQVNPGTGSANYANRVLTKGSDTIDYNVYTNGARSIVWGDGTGGSSPYTIVTNGTVQAGNYFGRIPAGQFEPEGTYQSMLNVTLDIT